MRYHMRRRDKEITDEASMKRILKTTEYITIAMAKDNQPYLVSLSHGYDEVNNCIYFHCAVEGKKLDYLNANNTVWGQALIDRGYAQGECSHHYATVMFSGKVTFLESQEEKWEALSLMIRQLDRDAETLIAKRKTESLNNTVIGRIDIDYMTGKKSQEVMV
ncbi:MAG: pyridoxamine 5'-phosphate oxidase family protein [Candidatus Bathyarchaeota archaeon]|nr:MAG: pyridoxamine 5'-phosphate oxidase family protein [Candidatus Bathyarchaeota archaeon]